LGATLTIIPAVKVGVKKQLIHSALTKNDGNWAAAAKDLGMHRSNLHHLAIRLGLREKAKKRNQ
jgi:transcriptional regulator with GAF, ATPase, and Fis domain